MFILLIDVDDDTRSVVFNDLSLHDRMAILDILEVSLDGTPNTYMNFSRHYSVASQLYLCLF
jgi:hypothetical protein